MASFKTAYLQKEIVLDVAVKAVVQDDSALSPAGATAIKTRRETPASLDVILKNDLVKLTPASGGVPAYIERVLSLAEATHIVAQSDVTMEYGHVPTEYRDNRYFPIVNGTAASPTTGSPTKKVALYKIIDADDVIIDVSHKETV